MTRTIDPFDELAALFLTEPDEPRAGVGDTRAATVELVVIGHLPVRAGLWLAPYADAVARETGPTALLRLDHDEPSLEVLRPPDAPVSPRACPTLRDAIHHMAQLAGTWVVKPAAGCVPPRELLEARPDRITILSSADEAAIVAAYQLLKDLVETAEQTGLDLPDVGLAVLGADRHAAERMRQRLNRTTSTYLQLQLPLVACVQRMDAAIRATACLRFADESVASLRSLLGWIRDACASAPRRRAPAEPPVQPAPPAEEPLAPSRTSTPDPKLSDRRPSISPAKIAPKPSIEVEPKEPARVMEPDAQGSPVSLAEHVEGLTSLAVRCPGHERLEIAVDSAGRMHIIAREAQLRELHVVAAWAKAHRELISMACPDQWIDPAGKPVCHVFTAEPATLADLHGCDLRLHVLAPVTVAGRRTWYAAPLNAAVR